MSVKSNVLAVRSTNLIRNDQSAKNDFSYRQKQGNPFYSAVKSDYLVSEQWSQTHGPSHYQKFLNYSEKLQFYVILSNFLLFLRPAVTFFLPHEARELFFC